MIAEIMVSVHLNLTIFNLNTISRCQVGERAGPQCRKEEGPQCREAKPLASIPVRESNAAITSGVADVPAT